MPTSFLSKRLHIEIDFVHNNLGKTTCMSGYCTSVYYKYTKGTNSTIQRPLLPSENVYHYHVGPDDPILNHHPDVIHMKGLVIPPMQIIPFSMLRRQPVDTWSSKPQIHILHVGSDDAADLVHVLSTTHRA